MSDDIMTTEEVAGLLRCSRDAVHDLTRAAGLPFYQLGRAKRYRRGEVLEWFGRRRTCRQAQPPAPAPAAPPRRGRPRKGEPIGDVRAAFRKAVRG